MTNNENAERLEEMAMMYPWRWGRGMTIAHCRSEQLRCAEQFHDAGARLGMNDWFCEEYLMDIENHMIAPGPDHPAYAEELEDDRDRDDRIYDRWKDEEDTNA